jgi:hypothetical protein
VVSAAIAVFKEGGSTLIFGASVKAVFLASIAVGLFGASALASDLPAKVPISKTEIMAPPYNWSGFYVGANFGGSWINGSLNIPGNNSTEASLSSSAASKLVIISRLVTFYSASKAILIGRVSIIPPFRL